MLKRQIGVTATQPCGFTEYVISTYDVFGSRTESKAIDCGRLILDGQGRWRHHRKGETNFAAAGETGRQFLARLYPERAIADLYAHAFSASIDQASA